MCSAGGRAVLRVVDRERRQQHCEAVGNHLLTRLRALAAKHDIIGDVRGAGLMLGVELVKDRGTKVRSGDTWVAAGRQGYRYVLRTYGDGHSARRGGGLPRTDARHSVWGNE